jgi:hypothetical protein
MTSAINPNNIDGTYPVAGQDNNSQGFRDNFTNTATNFQYAADEISDLQSKVVLKQALTGTTLDNNMLGSPLSNALLSNMSEARFDQGTLSGTVTINYAVASYQTVSTSGPISLAFTNSNWPPAGQYGSVIVEVTVNSTAHTLQLPLAVSVNASSIPGATLVSGIGYLITFPATGVYSFEFTSYTAGSTVTVNQVNGQLQPLNNTVDLVSTSGNISLATSASLITSSANLVSILGNGVSGQTKVIAYGNVSTGNALVTVLSAGWKNSGNGVANLHTTGSAVTLQYINSKWYAIGNNGVTFS